MFQDCRIPLETVAAQAISIVHHFRPPNRPCKIKYIRDDHIDKTMPWGFFDGASQDNQLLCGGGGVI